MTRGSSDPVQLRAEFEELLPYVMELNAYRTFWREVVEEFDDSFGTDSAWFCAEFTRMYGRSQVMSIRRLVDQNRRSRSLVRLLGKIERSVGRLNRDWFVDRAGPIAASWAGEEYDRWCKASGDRTIDIEWVAALRSDLVQACTRTAIVATRTVAHFQPLTKDEEITFSELDGAIDAVNDAMGFCRDLLVGSNFELTPTPQGDILAFLGPRSVS